MAIGKLHLICGYCGCDDEWEWQYVKSEFPEDYSDTVTLTCQNCVMQFDLNEKAKERKSDEVKCPDCKGTGRDNVPYGERCDRCNGYGARKHELPKKKIPEGKKECIYCWGRGGTQLYDDGVPYVNSCFPCGGRGYTD